MSFCKPTVLLIFFLIVNTNIFSQKNNDTDIISVKSYVVGKYESILEKGSVERYFILGCVSNNRDTTISFWIMSRSFPINNWSSSNDSIWLEIPQNNNNSPVPIKLLPHQTINFYFVAIPKNATLKNKAFQLGFNFTDPKASKLPYDQNRNEKVQKYWSNLLILEDKTFHYEIEDCLFKPLCN